MKKHLAILLALMMILSTMCGMTVSAAEPSADAPIYHLVAGPQEGFENAMNIAFGQTLFSADDWTEDYAGKFSLALTVENTDSAASGLVYVKYDASKVKPKTAKVNALKKFQSWEDAVTGNSVAYATENSAEVMGSNIIESGVNVESNYAFIVWNGSAGAINADEWNGMGYMAELGTFVFETLEGVTVGDFDANTFVVADAATIGRSPVSLVADGDKVYGETGADMTRIPMAVNFSYPMGSGTTEPPAPPVVETFTVTFMADGVQVGEVITKNVGETVTEDEFPEVPVKDGYTGTWNVTGDITETTVVEAVYAPIPVETFTVTFVVDGETVATITKNVGEAVTEAEFPVVEDKAGYTFAWDVEGDITEETTVTGTYTAIEVDGLKLLDLETTGFSVGTFDSDTMNYAAIADDAFMDNYYVIKGIAADGVAVSYIIDGIEAEYTVDGALYFDMMAGTTSSIQIKLDDGEGETIYTVDVTSLSATNDFFFTSGFDFDFDPEVYTYEVMYQSLERYIRLWAPEYSNMTIEYAVGGADDTAEAAEYAKLAVGCDDREDMYFGDTANFDSNWSEKSFVNLWTADMDELNKMFIKITVDGEAQYYTINVLS